MSGKAFVWALGAMSGTSLDGVDAAMIQTDGVTIKAFGASKYRTYSSAEREVIRKGLGALSGPAVEAAGEVVENAHAELLSQFSRADIVGFHGQTLTHLPDQATTLQAGNGQVLADVLDTPVVWDFRSADVELGGQGAPLASFYHFALAKHMRADEPLAFLNLGGVGNLTWLDPTIGDAQSPGACLAFDTGPANAPIDDLCQSRLGTSYDKDGALAASGTAHAELIEAMLSSTYFAKVPPKSLDRNDFSNWLQRVEPLSDADAAATLAAGCAAAVAMGLEQCPTVPSKVLLTGGGRKNKAIVAELEERLPCAVLLVEDAGYDGDMLEAQAFAYLAVRVLNRLPTSQPGTTGVPAPVGGGVVSHPREMAATK